MIRGELIRREAATSVFLPFHFVVHDEPAAVSDAALATKAIEGERDNRADRRASVVITPGIQEAVETALAARHPRQFARPSPAIVSHVIVESPNRHRANELAAALERADDALIERGIEAAKAKLARLRGAH